MACHTDELDLSLQACDASTPHQLHDHPGALKRDLNASRAQLRHNKQAMTANYTHPEDNAGLDAVSAAFTAEVIPLRRGVS